MDAPDFRENGHGCCCGEHSQRGARISEHSHGCSSGEHCQIDTRMIESNHSCSCGEHGRRNMMDTDLSCCFQGDSGMHNDSQTCATDYESRYYQLKMEKEKMERNYDRERREKEDAERKFRQELEEKSLIEDKFSSLNQSIQRYDDDLNLLKNENHFLKGQFDSLKNAINSRMSAAESGTSYSMHLDQEFSSSSTATPLSESVDADSYKHEVAALANENDVLRQIIEIINQQSQEKASWDERLSEKYTFDRKWQTDPEVAQLKEENSKLKSKIRELERSRREQESEMEEVTLDMEDQSRKTKKDISRLEDENHSKSLMVEDLERQLYQLRMEYHEEVQKWELKLEAEVLMKTQVQEEVNVLQGVIQNLEAERIEMVTKLEELYSSENDIIQARNDLEARFSVEISELQARLEEEIRTKVELSQEMTVLMNEFVDLRNKSKQMEEIYLSEIEALRFNSGFEMGEGAATQNVATGAYLIQQQQTNGSTTTGQRLTQSGGRNVRNDVQSQLNQEIQKREALEKENKELLYKMKNILSNSDQHPGEQGNQAISLNASSYSSDTNEAGGGSHHLRKKIRALENKVAELTEECETLQRSAKKGREVEKKNRELLSELDDLSTQRDDMLRKQRTLVYEVEKSSSSLHDTMDKNRRLIDDMDSKSRRIRDMEDNFRQERNSLIRSYDREKSSEIRDIERKREDLEKRLDDQIRENRRLENKVRDLEEEIRYLKQSNGQNQLGNMTSWSNAVDSNRKGPNVSNSTSKMTTNSLGLAQETLDLEQLLQERKRLEDDHLKALEEQRKQMREEFEMEKQKLRQCFEDEKRNLANRFTAGSGMGSHGMPGNVPVPGMNSTPSSVVIQDTYYTQTGQTRQPMPQNPSIAFPNAQSPVTSQNMFSNQQHSFLDAYHMNQTSPQEIGNQGSIPNYQVPQQPNQLHVSFQTPQPHSQQQIPYPNQYSVQGTQSVVQPQVIPGIRPDSQLNPNLASLQQEVQRLNEEKKNMEKRLKNMERRMASTSGNIGAANNSMMSMSACDIGSSSENEKEYMDNTLGNHPDNMQETSRSSTVAMNYSSDGNIDGRLQVTMKKLVEEHRQHSDELRRQMKLQKDSFEKEKIKMQREYSALLSNIKCLKREVHILKHERETMREKLKKERKESQMREERSREEWTTIRKEYEMKIRQEIEKSERTVRELQRKISISERTLKEFEIKLRDEVTQIEKKYSQERMVLEGKLRESENQVRSRLEFHYQAKLNTEKEKYENTLKDLRKEIKCLQAQRREIQLKISSKDASDASVATQKDTSYNVVVQNKDFYRRFEKEVETRFAQEKRRLEDTILDLRKEVEELKKEKTDIKSSYREEKLQREEQFEREKKRMEERHRYDVDELKRTNDMLEDNNIKLISMQGGISTNRHQKTTNNPQTTIIHRRNTSLELKNSELETDITYLKGRLSNLESRQTKLLTSHNDKSSSAGERKVRFSSNNGSKSQLRRSLSSTDLQNMAGSGYATDTLYTSVSPVISRDDLGISSSRLASHGTALSSRSFAAGNSIGNAGFLSNSYARNTDIAHIPSIGILNGANGHGLAGSRDTNIAYGGGNLIGSSLGLSSSGSHGGIGSGSAISGNYSRNTSNGSFLSGDGATASRLFSGNTSGIGSTSYLSANSGFGGGVLSGNALGSGLFSGKNTGLIGGSISGVGGGSSLGNSSFLSGNRCSGSVSGFLSSNSHRDGLSSGNLATSGLGSSFGNSSNNIGMQSSLSSGQRIVGSGQALSGSFGGGSLGYGASSGMSCGNCSSLRGV